nr:hypothetical protein Csa_5G430250 [Ipomoea batatas]
MNEHLLESKSDRTVWMRGDRQGDRAFHQPSGLRCRELDTDRQEYQRFTIEAGRFRERKLKIMAEESFRVHKIYEQQQLQRGERERNGKSHPRLPLIALVELPHDSRTSPAPVVAHEFADLRTAFHLLENVSAVVHQEYVAQGGIAVRCPAIVDLAWSFSGKCAPRSENTLTTASPILSPTAAISCLISFRQLSEHDSLMIAGIRSRIVSYMSMNLKSFSAERFVVETASPKSMREKDGCSEKTDSASLRSPGNKVSELYFTTPIHLVISPSRVSQWIFCTSSTLILSKSNFFICSENAFLREIVYASHNSFSYPAEIITVAIRLIFVTTSGENAAYFSSLPEPASSSLELNDKNLHSLELPPFLESSSKLGNSSSINAIARCSTDPTRFIDDAAADPAGNGPNALLNLDNRMTASINESSSSFILPNLFRFSPEVYLPILDSTIWQRSSTASGTSGGPESSPAADRTPKNSSTF